MGVQPPKASPQKKSTPPIKSTGLLDRLISLFANDDPERQKQKLLRGIAADLKRSRARFYSPSKLTVEPNLARFFWAIYSTMAAGQVLLKDAKGSSALRMAVVDLHLSKNQALLRERVSEKSIDERSKKGEDAAKIEAEVKADLKSFLESIDTDWMNDLDALFNRILVFLDLMGFDYFFLLKKFDLGLPERDFSYKPNFRSIEAANVLEELQDFLEILPNIDVNADWDRILAVLKEHRGMEVVARDGLRKTIQLIRDVQRNDLILLIVRHIMQNPRWKPLNRTHRERIVEPYLVKVKAEAETTVQKVAHSRRNEKLEELARAVFGSGAVAKLANYSEQSNPEYAQRMLGGFLHVSALSYLRAFLVEYLPKSIREVVDLLIIKGKWSDSQPSNQMSEAFHQLLTMSERISQFDANLAEDGELGRRLKTIALRADKDRKALIQLRTALQQVNDEARMMIVDSLQHFVAIARVLKLAYEEIGKPNPASLLNWKELRPSSDKGLRTVVATAYKKIFSFVQLMQMYQR
jgi:hypothetical protein